MVNGKFSNQDLDKIVTQKAKIRKDNILNQR